MKLLVLLGCILCSSASYSNDFFSIGSQHAHISVSATIIPSCNLHFDTSNSNLKKNQSNLLCSEGTEFITSQSKEQPQSPLFIHYNIKEEIFNINEQPVQYQVYTLY